MVRPASLPTRDHTRSGAGAARGRRQGAGQGSSVGHPLAERPSASVASSEENTALRTVLVAQNSQGNRSASNAAASDVEGQQKEPVADRGFQGSKDDVPCSRPPFHDSCNESEKLSFRNATDPLAAGNILVTRLYGPDGSGNSETAFCAPDVRDFGRGAGSGDTPDNRKPEDKSVPNWRLQSSAEDLPCPRRLRAALLSGSHGPTCCQPTSEERALWT